MYSIKTFTSISFQQFQQCIFYLHPAFKLQFTVSLCNPLKFKEFPIAFATPLIVPCISQSTNPYWWLLIKTLPPPFGCVSAFEFKFKYQTINKIYNSSLRVTRNTFVSKSFFNSQMCPCLGAKITLVHRQIYIVQH